MSFLLGGNRSQAVQSPSVSGMQVQTSAYGKAITIAYGTIRLAPNLLWYGDFKAVKHPQSGGGKGGVAGGGGGKGGGGGANYTYNTSVLMGLCEGPIQDVLNVYKDKSIVTPAFLGMTIADGNYPQTPWDYLSTNHGYLSQVSVVPATPYQVQATYHDPFLIDNGVTAYAILTMVSVGPTASQYTMQKVNQRYLYTFNAARAGDVVQITGTGTNPQIDVQTIPASAPYTVTSLIKQNRVEIPSTVFTPTVTMPPPAPNQYHVDSDGLYTFNSANAGDTVTISYSAGDQVPSFEALGYNGIAWAAAAAYDLGNSPSLSNHNFEVRARYAKTVGVIDAPPSPTVTQIVGGLKPSGLYEVTVTWVTEDGETDASTQHFISLLSHHLMKVTAPTSPPSSAIGWNVYVEVFGSGISYKQNVALLALGVDWTEPTTGFLSGTASGPTVNTTGLPDADPSNVVVDLLTNENYGADFPLEKIAETSSYQSYVLAANLLISFTLDSQTSASSILEGIATVTNSEWVFSSDRLNLVPYGDTEITGNGYTYTPPSAALYDLDDDDFIPQSDTDPVVRERKRPTDVQNWMRMEFKNRDKDYNNDIAEAKNQAWIDLYKLRPNAQTGNTIDFFANADSANIAIRLLLQRQLILNYYTFTTDQRYIALDPMDIVTITDAALGLNRQAVRIKKITENSDNTLTFFCEEYLAGIGSSPVYQFQGSSGFSANYNSSPGDVNVPAIFEAPVQIATNTGLETWILPTGGDNWGGCQIFVSSDGNTFSPVSRTTGNGRQGSFTASTSDTVTVDLSICEGILLSGTPADATQGNTLCFNSTTGELFSYTTATLLSPYVYQLSGLVRAMYGTEEGAFTGDGFYRLDGQVVTVPYDKTQIGQTLYVKFLSFNLYGGGGQNLSDVDAYTHVVAGPPIPPDVGFLNAQQVDNSVAFQWPQVEDFALKGYDILYGPQGGSITGATFLTEATKGTEMTNASVLPGCWTFYILARDIADQVSGTAATYDLCVVNKNVVLLDEAQAPNWPNYAETGGHTRLVKHWNGSLVPESQNTPEDFPTISGPVITPTVSTTPGGALPTRRYIVVITYALQYPLGTEETDYYGSDGVSVGYWWTEITVPANELLYVQSPIYPPDLVDFTGTMVGWRLYVIEDPPGDLYTDATLQGDTIQVGVDWVEPLAGIVSGGVTAPLNNGTGYYALDHFVPNPFTFQDYVTQEYDFGFDSQVRPWADTIVKLGPGETGYSKFQFAIDHWLTGEVDPAVFQDWIIQVVNARYVIGEIYFDNLIEGSVPFLKKFNLVVDGVQSTTEYLNVSISVGGTTLTFDQEYHDFPFVTPVVSGGPGTSAVASLVTTTDCLITVYNGAVDVGGTVNVTVKGL